jgi:transposase
MTQYISKPTKAAIIGYYRSGATNIEIADIVQLSTGMVADIISHYLTEGKHN